jgi:hypothetical protein
MLLVKQKAVLSFNYSENFLFILADGQKVDNAAEM